MIKSLKHRKGKVMNKNLYLTSDMEVWTKEKGINALTYLIINNIEDFIDFCEKYDIQYLNSDETGFYQWSDCEYVWEEVTDEMTIEKLKKIIENNSTKSDIWNLKITLLHDKEIKTNSKGCSLDELFEAIQAMQKPSLFGEQVKSFTIYKE